MKAKIGDYLIVSESDSRLTKKGDFWRIISNSTANPKMFIIKLIKFNESWEDEKILFVNKKTLKTIYIQFEKAPKAYSILQGELND